MTPTAEFRQSIVANLAYWQTRAETATEQQFGALDFERHNLYRAVQFGLGLPQTRRLTVQLILRLFEFVEHRTYWREWLPVLEKARVICDTEPDLEGRLLNQLGYFRRLNGELAQAIETHLRAEKCATQAEESEELARAHFNLSEDYRHLREYAQAEHYGQLAWQGFREIALRNGPMASVLNTLGLIAQARGQLAKAEEYLSQAVECFQAVQQPTNLARSLTNLADTWEKQGEIDKALAGYRAAASALAETASELDKVSVNLSLGTLYFNQGRLAEAETAFREADSPYLRQSSHLFLRAIASNNLGNVLLAQERYSEARVFLESSLRLWRQIGDNLMRANTLGTLGELLGKLRQTQPAVEAYSEAIHLLEAYPDDAWAKKLLSKFTTQRAGLVC